MCKQPFGILISWTTTTFCLYLWKFNILDFLHHQSSQIRVFHAFFSMNSMTNGLVGWVEGHDLWSHYGG
jgi:hypothetical protein